jgi:hypothetical protein
MVSIQSFKKTCPNIESSDLFLLFGKQKKFAHVIVGYPVYFLERGFM